MEPEAEFLFWRKQKFSGQQKNLNDLVSFLNMTFVN